MCGKEEAFLLRAIIEGVTMKVCADCAKMGNILEMPQQRFEAVKKREHKTEEPALTYNVTDKFASKIKEAREKMGLTQEKLGEAVCEKVSVIQNIEGGKLVPSLKLARKFENFFHIKLIEEYEEKAIKKPEINFKDSKLTIGDLINLKKEKKSEQ